MSVLSIDSSNKFELQTQTLVGRSVAVLGITGSGKTNTAAVLIEELLANDLPLTIVVLANSDVFFVSGQTPFGKSTA